MAKKTTTKKAKQTGKENRVTQILIMILLAGCCFGSFYLYRNTGELVTRAMLPASQQVSLPDPATAAEQKEVDSTQQAVSSLGRASSQVMQSAMLAEISGRHPFGTVSALSPSRGTAGLAGIGEVIDEPLPPSVTVVAIMIKGGDRVAMIDVDGEEGGLVVRAGSKFFSGAARITQINPGGVKYTWMRKNFEVAIPK